MSKDRLWLLAARKLAGEASAAELSELEQLLQPHPDLQIKLEAMSRIWGIKTKHESKPPGVAQLWKRIDRNTPSPMSEQQLFFLNRTKISKE